jgi:hypothetical protein
MFINLSDVYEQRTEFKKIYAMAFREIQRTLSKMNADNRFNTPK